MYRERRWISTVALTALVIAVAGCGNEQPTQFADSASGETGLVVTQGFHGTKIVELRGTAVGEERVVDGVPMLCFDVGLYDLVTGRKIGTGTDCLDLGSISGGDPSVEGFAVSNTTFFNFPGGDLKSRNRTTIQPVVEGSPGVTHLTGDVPEANNILDGTGMFGGARGTVRLAGAVDMSRFFSDTEISFNCVFLIDLKGAATGP